MQSTLPGQEQSCDQHSINEENFFVLKQGRPRMRAEACYYFWMLCLYAGGIKSRGSVDLLKDSKSVELLLHEQGCKVPSTSTILENVNAISEATRLMVMDAQFLDQSEIASQMFTEERPRLETAVALVNIAPSPKKCLLGLYQDMCQDLDDLCKVIQCCTERIIESCSRSSSEKVLSISDLDAAFLKKGSREPRIGYKTQLSRSEKGLVTGIIVPDGNVGDAPQLEALCEQTFERTGIIAQDFSADGGYCSIKNREWLLAKGVERVSFCSSKGKKITQEEEWESPEYLELRRWRSAVEALMSQIKNMVNFGSVIRRGLEKVKAELTDKIIAFNFKRLNFLRT